MSEMTDLVAGANSLDVLRAQMRLLETRLEAMDRDMSLRVASIEAREARIFGMLDSMRTDFRVDLQNMHKQNRESLSALDAHVKTISDSLDPLLDSMHRIQGGMWTTRVLKQMVVWLLAFLAFLGMVPEGKLDAIRRWLTGG